MAIDLLGYEWQLQESKDKVRLVKMPTMIKHTMHLDGHVSVFFDDEGVIGIEIRSGKGKR